MFRPWEVTKVELRKYWKYRCQNTRRPGNWRPGNNVNLDPVKNNAKNSDMREDGKLDERMRRIQEWRGVRNVSICQHERELGDSKA